MAIKQYSNLDFQGLLHPINVIDPSSAQDVATKNYVDAIAVQGAFYKQEVLYATTGALPANTYSAGVLTATSNAALAAQDGQTPALNDRLLVKNEATGANNGIYTVTQVGTGALPYILTRTPDADAGGELNGGATVFVKSGTVNGGTVWTQNVATVTIGTTAQTWVQTSGTVTYPISIGQGGTGQTTAANARSSSALGAQTAPTGGATARGITLKVDQTLTSPTSAGSPYTITHNLGTQSVIVQAWDVTTNASIGVTSTAPTVNTVQISFDTNEANNVLVVVQG